MKISKKDVKDLEAVLHDAAYLISMIFTGSKLGSDAAQAMARNAAENFVQDSEVLKLAKAEAT